MIIIDLTNVEVLKDLTTVKNGETFFDLHNDYDCTEIDYKSHEKTLGFWFEPHISKDKKSKLYLLFENVTLSTFSLYLKRTTESYTLDSFYRGRYEINNMLFEYSSTGEGYFYIEFLEGDSFELFSSKVCLLEKSSDDDQL